MTLKARSKFKIWTMSPGWCSSVDWVPAYKPRGHWFNSQTVHTPQLQASSPVGGVGEATHQCFSRTLMFLSLLLPLKIYK